MTLTYFMARSAEVAYPRSQVSVYRTIGPLVSELSKNNTRHFCFHQHLLMHDLTYEPPREKTNNLHRRKQSIYFLNTKFHASSCYCAVRFVSDLVGNHIVGFPTRRLICQCRYRCYFANASLSGVEEKPLSYKSLHEKTRLHRFHPGAT